MTDMFDTKKRSEIMAKVKGSNTTLEIRVRKLFHSMGYRFRLHCRDLPGNPDIVLPKYKTVVFVHGCFWHGCPTCKHAKIRPTANAKYWNEKLDRTLERDKRIQTTLEEMGWKVMVIWECEAMAKNAMILTERVSKIRLISGV